MAEPSSDRLAEIIAYKRDEVARLKQSRSLSKLEAEAQTQAPPRGFASALQAVAGADGNALICEIKRRSPSAGAINLESSPAEAARAYQAGGAACISVLTDGPSFGGSLADLATVRDAVSLPLLRKDFMIDPLQILEARAAGADAILLIMAVLSDSQARELHAAADALQMSVLLEAHDAGELERSLALPSPLVGINNRNLRTFTTDLGVSEELAARVPTDRLVVAESGLKEPADVSRLRRAGVRAFLIGESVMRTANVEAAVRGFVTAR